MLYKFSILLNISTVFHDQREIKKKKIIRFKKIIIDRSVSFRTY